MNSANPTSEPKPGPCQCPDCLMNRAKEDMLAALREVEAVMSVIEPRSNKLEYLACLDHVRRTITKATKSTE